jgi:hypothetical protein
MFKLYAVQVAWLVRGLWKIVRPLLDEFTASKINIYGGNDFEQDMHKVIAPENLEEKYLGKLKNKVDNFFPPDLL